MAKKFNGVRCWRTEDGEPITSIDLKPREIYHSPAGYEWGYSGSGPSDLALNILMQYTDKDTAYRLHQEFKETFIAGMPQEGGAIPAEVIKEWIADRQDKDGRP